MAAVCHVHTHTHTHTLNIYKLTVTHAHTHTHTHNVYTHKLTATNSYTHTHTHLYTHTHTHTQPLDVRHWSSFGLVAVVFVYLLLSFLLCFMVGLHVLAARVFLQQNGRVSGGIG